MRDLLHPRAEARGALGSELGSLFAAHGYDLVVTPPFEHAEVLERGLVQLDRRDLLRFVEPESGEVALLRPDITPQIARVVATRIADLPPPFRLRYRGTVIRRRRGRARKHRQIVQVGVEHIGEASAVADVEIATLACRAAEVAGLSAFRLELRSVRLGGTLLSRLPPEARDDAEQALSGKETAELARILGRVEVDDETRRGLDALPRLFGGREVLSDARRLLPTSVVGPSLDALEVLAAGLDESGVGERVIVDLGETRGMAYYTGPSFVLLAEGPGEPVGGGGRYDELLGRFGAPLPATGFAMDLGNLEWALGGQAARRRRSVRIACFGETGRALVSALREAGAQVAELAGKDEAAALAFARAWGYDAALALGEEHRALRVRDGSERALGDEDALALLSWAAPD